ncbi:hypothetical protein HGP29_24585 [Flammeovirga sp. SR4]|uniref:Glycine zipper domain-containing protein n=2 Tax=Flammeovirgaceae TaxID=200667 RepID=A0A7X8SQ85_9BACT|nr:hypothetical protein [Flammeovirga agarivorans]
MYIVPTDGQSAANITKDQSECYQWAVNQTGYDPANPPQITPTKATNSADGTVVKNTAVGAGTGAAIGAVAGDAGKGAAIGAIAGTVRGAKVKHDQKKEQQAANNAQAEQQLQQMDAQFKKAFSACMTGKGYTVK